MPFHSPGAIHGPAIEDFQKYLPPAFRQSREEMIEKLIRAQAIRQRYQQLIDPTILRQGDVLDCLDGVEGFFRFRLNIVGVETGFDRTGKPLITISGDANHNTFHTDEDGHKRISSAALGCGPLSNPPQDIELRDFFAYTHSFLVGTVEQPSVLS
jgi:hypothetical protein